LKFNFAGVEFTFYKRNIFNDNQILIRAGNTSISTKEVKLHIDNILRFIRNTVEALSIVDEKYERYSTALNFLVSAKGIFNARTPEKITEEAAKITIDVIKEIALLSESTDDIQRSAIKSAAFVSKLAIDTMGMI